MIDFNIIVARAQATRQKMASMASHGYCSTAAECLSSE